MHDAWRHPCPHRCTRAAQHSASTARTAGLYTAQQKAAHPRTSKRAPVGRGGIQHFEVIMYGKLGGQGEGVSVQPSDHIKHCLCRSPPSLPSSLPENTANTFTHPYVAKYVLRTIIELEEPWIWLIVFLQHNTQFTTATDPSPTGLASPSSQLGFGSCMIA